MGRVNRDNVGFAMPVDAPLYATPPIIYKDLERIAFTYETDAEAVQNVLPEGLEVPEPATATLLFIKYPFSTLGPYLEAILSVGCIWQGDPRGYIAHIVLDTDAPTAAGREIWGFPKKLAHITFENEGDLIIGTMERPEGNRICTGVIRPERQIEEAARAGGPGLSLRVIPSPEEGQGPSLMELIETPSTGTTKDAWEGTGSAVFNSPSDVDPRHRFAVKKMLRSVYMRGDMVLPFGRIVKRY
jgi:acetoacetate decarboxylase